MLLLDQRPSKRVIRHETFLATIVRVVPEVGCDNVEGHPSAACFVESACIYIHVSGNLQPEAIQTLSGLVPW